MRYFDEDNTEKLSKWLSKELEPLTLADPDTLAEYVIALLKHDKESHDLAVFCKEELSDFLKENTEPFVKLLFEALEDRRYLQSTIATTTGAEEDDEDDVDGTVVGHRRGRGDDDDDDDRDSRRRDSRRRDSDDHKRQRGGDNDNIASTSSRSSKQRGSEWSKSDGRAAYNSNDGGRSGQSDISPQSDHRRSDYQDNRNKGYSNKDTHNRPYEYGGDRQQQQPPRGYPFNPPTQEFMPSPMDPMMMMGAYGYPPHMMTHPAMGVPMGYPPYSTMGMGYPTVAGSFEDGGGLVAPPLPPVSSNAGEIGTQSSDSPGKPAPPPGPMPPKGAPGPFAAAWAAPAYPPSNTNMPAYYSGASYDYSGASISSAPPAAPPVPSGLPSVPAAGYNSYNSMYPTQYGTAPYGGTSGSGMGRSRDGHNNNGGGQRRNNSNQALKNDLPENERFALLCTGIPKYIKEEEMMTHFKAFGRVVQLQVTASDPTSTGTPADAAASTDEKKTYNECLVQFGSWEDAKKCFSSPEAVLNNRFIRIQQSSFNIIPPADVAPATTEELLEIETIQKNKSAAAKAKATGVSLPLATAPPRPRAPRPVLPLGKPAKNKKYIAGVTPISATKPTSESTSGEDNVDRVSVGKEGGDAAIATMDTTFTTTKEADHGEEEMGISDSIDSGALPSDGHSSSSSSLSKPTSSLKPSRPSAPVAPTKATIALQQQYDDLRKLRGRVDNIWKTKHNLLQGQIDKYHEMITLLNKVPSDKNASTIEELESKIVDLQSQLRVIQEQQETGTLQQQQQIQQQQQAGDPMTGGRGSGRGGGRAASSFGRFGRGFAGGRGGGRLGGGRWLPAGPGGRGSAAAVTKNMSIDNRPRSLLVPAQEWTQLPATFTANIKTHFSKFGEVKNMTSQSNGDIVIEYNSRREAEIAKNNGAVYENTPMRIDWYQQQGQQGQRSSIEKVMADSSHINSGSSGGDGMMVE